jgi:hypothetical protein
MRITMELYTVPHVLCTIVPVLRMPPIIAKKKKPQQNFPSIEKHLSFSFIASKVKCPANFKSTSVGNPDPQDPHVFGPPGSGSVSQRNGSVPSLFS